MHGLKKKAHAQTLRKLPSLPATEPPAAATAPVATAAPEGALMTPREVAARLRVTEKTLENWRGSGAGPAFIRLGHRCVRYRSEDVNTFVAGRVRQNTAER